MKDRLPSPDHPLRIGTRGSPLALAQAREARDRLMAAHGLPEAAFAISVIRTSGDAVQDRPLARIGGKGLFTKEIEEALLEGRIDIAVHSMKDVPTWSVVDLAVDCILPREDVRDGFVSRRHAGPAILPAGAVIGTSSLRRKAQLLHRWPHLHIVEFRGNVQTRLAKLDAGIAEATLLAMAGLRRLQLDSIPAVAMAPEDMLPAVAQGAIGIQHRLQDEATAQMLAAINDPVSRTRVWAERAFLEVLDGSCQTPIAGLAEIEGDVLRFRGEIIRPDGSQCLRHEISGRLADADRLGREAALVLKGQAGPGFFLADTGAAAR